MPYSTVKIPWMSRLRSGGKSSTVKRTLLTRRMNMDSTAMTTFQFVMLVNGGEC